MAINKIEHDEVEAKIILSDIGMINETDVSLAKASNAILIGFNVKPNREAKRLAEDGYGIIGFHLDRGNVKKEAELLKEEISKIPIPFS